MNSATLHRAAAIMKCAHPLTRPCGESEREMTSIGLLWAAMANLCPATPEALSSGEVWLEPPGALSQALPCQSQEATAAECAGLEVCAGAALRGAGCRVVGHKCVTAGAVWGRCSCDEWGTCSRAVLTSALLVVFIEALGAVNSTDPTQQEMDGATLLTRRVATSSQWQCTL